MKLLPDRMMPFLKAWVALIGVVLVAITTSWDAAPEWLTIAAAAVTAVGVYLTPNREGYKPKHDDSLRA